MTDTLRILRPGQKGVHEETLDSPRSLKAGDIILPTEGFVFVAAKTTGIVSLLEPLDGNPDSFVNHIYSTRNLGVGNNGEPTPLHPQEYLRVEYDGTESVDRQSYELLRSKLNLARQTLSTWTTERN